ncbi:MAG: ferrous iron transport protein B [Candidatus Omnitrophota bacterium]
MHEHKKREVDIKGKKKIILIGNPNVGKSVVFALLTGKYVTVSNYPGTTVEVTYGRTSFGHKEAICIDSPGVNSLIPQSEDERVARDMLLEEQDRIAVVVADAKNLQRSLLLTVQLIEMEIPLVLDLNMFDEAVERSIKIDLTRLKDILGVECVETVATEKMGLAKLIHAISNPLRSNFKIDYGKDIESAITEISSLLPDLAVDKRAISLILLSKDETLNEHLLKEGVDKEIIYKINGIVKGLQAKYSRPLSFVIAKKRHDATAKILEQVFSRGHLPSEGFAEKLGRVMMHPFWGIPFMAAVLVAVYKFVGQFGAGTLVNFLENVIFGKFLNPWATKAVEFLIPIKFFQEMLVGQYGIITMAITYSIAIIFPIVGTFFITFGLLEDSGYLPRLAVMVDKIFNLMGLNGKAVLPMVLGLGCGTMATLTTRILETKKERVIATLLLALAIPCSAQLGVILSMLAGISWKASLVWIVVIALNLLVVGAVANKLLRGRRGDFILEIPPIRMPQVSNILLKVAARIKWYLKEAVPLFILGTLILFFANKIGLLVLIEKAAAPIVVGFLDLPIKATAAFIVGFLRRDYGAAGLYVLQKEGLLDPIQVLVSVVTITLFVPCIAQFFVTIKERGMKAALIMALFIFPYAFLFGGFLNYILRILNINLL